MGKAKKSNLNDTIKLYVSFCEALMKSPDDQLIIESKKKLDIVYNTMKSDQAFKNDLKHLVNMIINKPENDIIFKYGENEEVLALMHLIIELIEDKDLIITDKEVSLENLKYLQDGLSKLWKSNDENCKEKITVYCCLIDQELRIIIN